MTEVNKPARPVPTRQKPTAAGKAGRWVAAGAAVGASLAMVGTMAGAAANAASAPASETTTVQRIVVPQAPVPEPIVIVLPQQTGAVSATDPIVPPAAVPARPQPAPAAAPTATAEPVAESGGS